MKTVQLYKNAKHIGSQDVKEIYIKRDPSAWGNHRRWTEIVHEGRHLIVEITLPCGEYEAEITSAWVPEKVINQVKSQIDEGKTLYVEGLKIARCEESFQVIENNQIFTGSWLQVVNQFDLLRRLVKNWTLG